MRANHNESESRLISQHGQSDQQDDLLWQQLKTLPAFRALLRSIEARFYRQLDLEGPILDVGCGDGHFAQVTFSNQIDVGIDPWQGPIREAKARDIYRLPIHGYGHLMPFPDGTFATAVSNSVLEHIPNIQPVLNDSNRVLKENGLLVITMPNDQFTARLGGALFLERLRLGILADAYRRLFNAISRHAHTDPPAVWAARLAQAGFVVERWQNYFSTGALHALELGHLQGLPSALLHFLSGHWILAPWRSSLRYTERWLRPYYEEDPPADGTMTLIVARKVASGPIEASLPPPSKLGIGEARSTEFSKIHSTDVDQSFLTDQNVEDHPKDYKAAVGQPSIFMHNRLFFLLAIVLALVARGITGTATNLAFSGIGVALWLLAIVSAIYLLWNGKVGRVTHRLKVALSGVEGLAIMMIVLVALAIRLVGLTGHPYILSGTEANIGLDAAAVANGQLLDPFASAWLSNPSMPAFIMALPQLLFGQSILGVRLLSPFIGSLTVLAVYFVGRMFWGGTAGIIAALLLATSHVHIHYSRLGMTNVWDPLVMLLLVGFLFLALKHASRGSWLLAGATVGFSAYLYTTAHLMPVVLLGLSLYLGLKKPRILEQKNHILAAMLLALVIALPQLVFYIMNPDIYMDRLNMLAIWEHGWLSQQVARTGSSSVVTLLKQLGHGLFAFNFGVDLSNSYPSDRSILPLIPSLLLAVGLGISLSRVSRFKHALLLTIYFSTVVIAGVLLVDPPSSHRLLVALPIVFLLVTRGMLWLGELASKATSTAKQYAIVGLLAIAILISITDLAFYFGRFRNDALYGDRNTEIAYELSMYINELDGRWQGYFFGPPAMYSSFPTFAYLVKGWQERIVLSDVEPFEETPPVTPEANSLFIYLPERSTEMTSLESRYPDGRSMELPGFKADPLVYIFEIPGNVKDE